MPKVVDLLTGVDPVPSAGLPAHRKQKHQMIHLQTRRSDVDRVGCARTRVDLAAFLRAHRSGAGLGSILLLAFSANGTEGGGVAQGGEGGLEIKATTQKQ